MNTSHFVRTAIYASSYINLLSSSESAYAHIKATAGQTTSLYKAISVARRFNC
nr:MAG TPA: hypothetical protein [Caudoviricetes sp.]